MFYEGVSEATPLISCGLRIILCLCVPQFVVFAVCIGNERRVSSLLNDRALVEHGDLVAELTRGQSVGGVDSTLSIYVTEKS